MKFGHSYRIQLKRNILIYSFILKIILPTLIEITLLNSRVNRFVKRLECNEQMPLSIIKLVDGKPTLFFLI